MSLRILATIGALVLLAGSAGAQPPRPGGAGATPRPAFSPYLNLVRPGGSPTLNYYGLVRPEVEARQSIQNLQGSVAANQQAIGDVQTGINGLNDLPTTGHQALFLNHGSYFLTGGAGRGPGGVSTGVGGGTRSSVGPRR